MLTVAVGARERILRPQRAVSAQAPGLRHVLGRDWATAWLFLIDPQRLQTLYSKVGGRWYPIYQNGTKDEFWTSKPQFKFYPDLLKGGRDTSYPAPPDPKMFAALGEIGTRLIIADMIQNVIVKGVGVQESVQQAHDAMVEVFKARGAKT